MVLDMGTPVRIVDIAQRMMTLAGRSCPITYTGLRDGEKLHEELFTPSEGTKKTSNGIAWHVRTSPLEPAFLEGPRGELSVIRQAYGNYVAETEIETETELVPVPGRSAALAQAAAVEREEPVGPIATVDRGADDEANATMLKEQIR